jgi:hypothetical protein
MATIEPDAEFLESRPTPRLLARGRARLENSPFGKAYCAAIRDDDVIEDPDVDQAQGVAEALGDELVGVAGFSDSGGVVVRQDHGGGLVFQGFDDDFAWVDAGAVDGAAEEVLGCDEAMALVEVN